MWDAKAGVSGEDHGCRSCTRNAGPVCPKHSPRSICLTSPVTSSPEPDHLLRMQIATYTKQTGQMQDDNNALQRNVTAGLTNKLRSRLDAILPLYLGGFGFKFVLWYRLLHLRN